MKLHTANGGRRNSGQGRSCLVLCVLLGSCGTGSSSTTPSSTTPVEPSPTANELTVEALADGSYRCHPDGTGPFPGILYNHGGLGTNVGGDLEGVCRSFWDVVWGGADLRSLLSRRMS
jgi:hypothetical protein